MKLAKKRGRMSLCNGIRIFKIGLRYSFIYQGTLTNRQQT